MKLIFLTLTLMIVGCSGYSAGDCVYVSGYLVDGVEKGVYMKYDDGSHWYSVDGEVRSKYDSWISVTSCSD